MRRFPLYLFKLVLPLLAFPILCVVPVQGAGPTAASDAVQIDVKDVFNARVFAVAKAGTVISLTDDIDGAGGVATAAASSLLGNQDAHPMPDDATFPATDRHPQVVLHYSNENSTENQARRCQGEDTFIFPVPAANYAHLHLFFTSGWGASTIFVKLVYADQSVEKRSLEIPDWYWELKPDDAYRSYLAVNLGKWNKKNEMIEKDHHFIFALDLTPSPNKVLVKVGIHKTEPSLMVFYGATGTLVKK